ncbi:M1 family metallopeptidase [Geodermatophilus sp. URMC 61]|uniref:M1 family metallopeptidase n=1 Tax=Geodermatophilus sp. URMC 61 TaxID=3423411 RepID=UPI00406CCDDD
MARRPVVLVATATVLVGLVPATAAADDGQGQWSGEPTPGAPGIGDPYYPLDGNGGYDVEHYDLDLRYDPATDVLSGTATVEATATQDLSAFDLDLEGLEVRSVTVDGRPATWSRDGGELTITPARPLGQDREFAVAVTYDGVPATIQDPALGQSGFFHTADGALVAGQPESAATWFPANDHPRDAASVAVSIAVPEGLEGISNGALEGTRTQDGWTTWSWRAEEPMATYLVTLAVGEFDIRAYEVDGIRYWDAVDPSLAGLDPDPDVAGPSVGEVVDAALARQPEVIEFLSESFGPYPFSTAGAIVDNVPGMAFALETQTRPVYAPGFFTDPVQGDLVVVHELAHQWYGDSVRLDAWQHIWLNEGFATYAEWLWLEREGLSTPQKEFDQLYANADTLFPGLQPPFWTVLPGDPGAATSLLFHPAVYQRGAMTLHALRQVVGDTAFFQVVDEWATSRAGQAVTTDEFTTLAEKFSGRELDDLFQAWLYTPERPVLG